MFLFTNFLAEKRMRHGKRYKHTWILVSCCSVVLKFKIDMITDKCNRLIISNFVLSINTLSLWILYVIDCNRLLYQKKLHYISITVNYMLPTFQQNIKRSLTTICCSTFLKGKLKTLPQTAFKAVFQNISWQVFSSKNLLLRIRSFQNIFNFNFEQ